MTTHAHGKPVPPVAERLRAADGGVCHVTRVVGNTSRRSPVVLLPGLFTDRHFWLSDHGVGLAADLSDAGHPVYILQRRQIPESRADGARPGLNEHLTQDLPALAERIATAHDAPAFWIGHSFGGLIAARGAAETLPAARVAGLVLLASQFEVGKRMLDWPGNLVTRAFVQILGYLPARLARLGPIDEPAAAVVDACDWVSRGRRDPALRESLARITAPILAISGAADRVDPSAGCRRLIAHTSSTDRTFIRAGRAEGYDRDYDHTGIVISTSACREIWPRILDWLAARDG